MAEEGVEGVIVSGYTNIVAPAGTPPAIVRKLEAELNAIIKLPDVVERFKTLAVYPVGGPGEQHSAQLAKDLATWREVVAKANIPLQ